MITTISATLESFVVETAKYLYEKCGCEITLICDRDDNFAKRLPEYIRYIPVPMSRGINLSGFGSIKKFKKIFKEEKFDLVQYSTPNASFYASAAAKAVGVPIRLYCQWGIRYVGFAGGIKRMIFKFLEKLVCKRSTHIFAVSPKNREFAIGEGLYPADKARVIGNGGTIGVDMTSYDIGKKAEWRNSVRERYGITDDDRVFGFAGRICADKGCVELISSFRELCRTNENAKLMMVGPMEENSGIPEELLSFAKESDRVIMTGRAKSNEMKEYYSAMDVLVHPTYREGFGMVIQEAGALAVPVITTKVPGASEVMVDGESCLLVEAGNADELLSAMRTVCESDELSAKLGGAAYERTARLYERKIMLENQKEAYVKLLGE